MEITNNLIQYVRKYDIKLVIPELGKLIYAGLPSRDYILVYTIDKGYIEGDDLDSCKVISDYLQQVSVTGAMAVGNLDKVKTRKGIVYRQRLAIQSITRILTICKMMDIEIVFPKSLQVGIQQFEYVGNSIGLLTKYYTLYHNDFPTMESWLLTAFLLQFRIIAELSGIKYRIECSFLSDKAIDCLYRSPYLACTVDKYNKYTTILDLDIEHIKYNGKPLFSSKTIETAGYYTNSGVKAGEENTKLFISGYSKKNIKEDRKRGVI